MSAIDLICKVTIGHVSELGATANIKVEGSTDLATKITVASDYVINDGLKGFVLVPEITDTPTPTFVWFNASDPDGDPLTYHFQMSPSGIHPSGHLEDPVIEASGIAEDAGNHTEYTIPSGMALASDTGYTWRVRAYDGYEYGPWSNWEGVKFVDTGVIYEDLLVAINIVPHTELPAKTTVVVPSGSSLPASLDINYASELPGSIYVNAKQLVDLGGSLIVQASGHQDLNAKVDIPPYADISGKIDITALGYTDLPGSINMIAAKDLPATIKLVEYGYKNLFVSIHVIDYEDLGATVYIPPGSNLGAKAFITHVANLPASVTIPVRSDIKATINVTQASAKNLPARLFMQPGTDLKATINVLATFKDLPARLTNISTLQQLQARADIKVRGESDLQARFRLVGLLKAKTMVRVYGSERLQCIATIVKQKDKDLNAKLFIVGKTKLPASVTISVFGDTDLSAETVISENRPDDVDVTAYKTPSLYPPLPPEWTGPSGLAVPPSGAVIIPSGEWQPDTAGFFVWPLPYPGDFADYDSAYVAWNEYPDYEITISDQRTAVNYIQKSNEDGGSMWFHVRAKNSFGHFSENTTHYNFKINRVPGDTSGPYYVNQYPNILGETSNQYPTMFWQKAYDPDTLDRVSYDMEIVPSGGFAGGEPDPLYFYDFEEYPFGTETRFTITSPLEKVGNYIWRVRSYDGKQNGSWSSWQPMKLAPATKDLPAKFTVTTPGFAQIKAKIDILPYENLPASIVVGAAYWSDLSASITPSYLDDIDLNAKIFIQGTSDLPASITINEYEDLNVSLNVVDVPGSLDLDARVNVGYYSFVNLEGRCNVKYGGGKDLSAKVRVPTTKDLNGSITLFTPTEDLPSKITVMVIGSSDLNAVTNVKEDKPGPVTLYCNVPEDTWQTNNLIEFTWDAASYGWFPIEGYYTKLDHSPTTEVGGDFQKVGGFAQNINLEFEDGSSQYYFHIAARNTVGNWGPTTHFNLKYNHVPTVPDQPMTVNGLDTIAEVPVIASEDGQTFAWGQSYDDDDLDAIYYRIQIATQEDFGINGLGQSSIVRDITGISFYQYTLTGIDILVSGDYYWRVSATDNLQESDWSLVGHFVMNTPPTIPEDLRVFEG